VLNIKEVKFNSRNVTHKFNSLYKIAGAISGAEFVRGQVPQGVWGSWEGGGVRQFRGGRGVVVGLEGQGHWAVLRVPLADAPETIVPGGGERRWHSPGTAWKGEWIVTVETKLIILLKSTFFKIDFSESVNVCESLIG